MHYSNMTEILSLPLRAGVFESLCMFFLAQWMNIFSQCHVIFDHAYFSWRSRKALISQGIPLRGNDVEKLRDFKLTRNLNKRNELIKEVQNLKIKLKYKDLTGEQSKEAESFT